MLVSAEPLSAHVPCSRCGGVHRSAVPCTVAGLAPIPLTTPLPDPLVGAQVGNFRLIRKLGDGGMATVYLAEHPVIGSQVAVKLLHPALANDPSVVRRFYVEARAAHQVAHPNIVQVLDLGMAPGIGLYLVMEYVKGKTLAQHLHGEPVPMEFAEAVLAQVCAALGSAHARGVVHRDLKPDNILVLEGTASPSVKVADFGIAKLRDELGTGATRAGDLVGTPLYMAPEQVQGQAVDARTDVYALGLVAYELAVGRRPFDGGPGTVMTAQLKEAPRPPRELRPELPAWWESAILRALAKAPEQRFPDAASFLAALRPPQRPRTRAGTSAALSVEVELGDGQPARRLRALELTRGGALIAFDGAPPPLRSTVRLFLGAGEFRTAVDAEVVRHLSRSEASTWALEPGFAVQFQQPPPGLERALESVSRAGPLQPRPERPGTLTSAQRARLERFNTARTASHYELLDLPFDAPLGQVLAHGSRAIAELRAIEQLPLEPSQADKIQGALARLAQALATLGNARERLRYDARLGNFRGIARGLDEGLAEELLAEEHAAFRAAHPLAAARSQVYLDRLRHAREYGGLRAMRFELEYALTGDPLNLELQSLWRVLQAAA